jgi:hypothetical protein
MKLTELKEKLNKVGCYFDSIGKNRKGNIVFRRGFFYRMGFDSKKFEERIIKGLKDSNISFELITSGEHYACFKGGVSIANQSHWYCEIKIKE